MKAMTILTKLNYTVALLMLILLTHGCAGVVVGGAATGAAVIHDRRSAGTVIDDQGLGWKISNEIFSDKELSEPSHINVTVYNGAVLLTGETPTEDLKLRANAIAARVSDKEKPVYNELAIAEPTSLTTRTNDAYITSKVKTALFDIQSIKGFDVTRVKVTTENSVVYLMGLVTSVEADAVTEKTRNVGGVKKVVKLFEYIK